MAISYQKPSRKIPRGQRVAHITNIAAADTVDILDILGFPARYVKIVTPDDSDVLEIRINNRYVLADVHNVPAQGEHGSVDPSTAEVITSQGAQHAVHEMTGSTTFYLEEGLEVVFLELVDMTPATATDVIELMAW
jgi:hypothetical protein